MSDTDAGRSGTETWALLPFDVGHSADHIALGDQLVRTVTVPTMWWHATDVPTLIMGPAQRREHPVSPDAGSSAVRRVLRQAGGTAVLATGGVLGLDVALPQVHRLVSADVVEAYRWLGEVWVSALSLLDVSAQLVSIAQARAVSREDVPMRALINAACFGSLSPYEVVADGRKLVGLAQVRRRNGELLQAGIHLDFDAERLAALLAPDSQDELALALRRHAVGLREVAPRAVSFADIMAVFREALEVKMNVRLLEVQQPDTWTGAANRT